MRKLWILLLSVALMLSLAGCKSDDYKEAMKMYVNEEYDAALAIFTELGDYEDSINMVTKCRYAQGHTLMESGRFEEARILFEELGTYEDSAECVLECDYRQARALMEAGQYEAAQALFAMLGDYKDSADYADGMGWHLFTAFVSEQGEVTPEDLLYNHIGSITVDSGRLCVEISNIGNSGSVNGGMTAKVIIDPESTKADLYATFHIEIGQYVISDKTFTRWEIGNYRKGQFIFWDDYDHYFSGKTAFGTANAADTPDTLAGETGVNLITALIGCLQKGIDESGLDLTLADLGFTNYDR